VTAIVSVLAFDFFFLPPLFRFSIHEYKHAITFAGMTVVAVVVSGLTEKLRRERERAKQSEENTSALYALERELSAARRSEQLDAVASRELGRLSGGEVTVIKGTGEELKGTGASHPHLDLDAAQRALASGTSFWPKEEEPRLAYVPLVGSAGAVGIAVMRMNGGRSLRASERELLESACLQVAHAMERMSLASSVERAHGEAEAERFKSSLLNAVSHDLRTPLAMISGCMQLLLRTHDAMVSSVRGEFLQTISQQADRLDNLVRNLLAMTRAEQGGASLRMIPGAVEDVVAAALRSSSQRFAKRHICVHASPGLPLVTMDPSLLEQVFTNLIENAVRYSPPDAPIEVTIEEGEDAVIARVADRGSGVPIEDRERVFEKFYRGRNARREDAGAGLGLAICKSIVDVHGGKIGLGGRDGGGTVVTVTLRAAMITMEEARARLPELA
jgi:two-component system sensor histidine kinase KdpD